MTEAARCMQRLRLVLQIEPVARLHLDRGDTLCDQRVEPRQGFRHQRFYRGRPQRLHRGDDAAPCPRHFLIGRTGEPHLEFVGAVSRVDQMGVAVDQPGGDPAAAAIDDVGTL